MLLGVATLLIPASPSYDPWSWIIWGREVLDGDLRTATGPSWKPLPVLFTAPLSLFGDAAPALWLVVARAAQFAAAVPAALIGFRLAGRLGAILSGGLLLSFTALWESTLQGHAEGALVLCVLAAVERHLAARHGPAFAWALGAALLRPEAWAFLGLYAAWLALRQRGRLAWIVPALAFVPLLWFLPEQWGSGSLSRGAERAQLAGADSPGAAEHPAVEVVRNAFDLSPGIVFLGLAAGLAACWVRRPSRRALLLAIALAALGVGWVAQVAVMSELGYSGIDRYLLPAVAIAHVLAGVGLAALLAGLVGARRSAATGAAVLLVLLGAGLMVRAGSADWPRSMDQIERIDAITDEFDTAVARAGGRPRLERCGAISASQLATPVVAWDFDRHLEQVTNHPRVPGSILRARLRGDLPVDPPLNALARTPGRTVLARTRWWTVEAACSPAAAGP